jgi:hypothetical protein
MDLPDGEKGLNPVSGGVRTPGLFRFPITASSSDEGIGAAKGVAAPGAPDDG